MSDDANRPAKRGEAKWKEVREAVAERNQAARKESRVRRDAFNRTREQLLRASAESRRTSRSR